MKLGQWTCTDTRRSAGRLGPQARHYQATLALGDTISTLTVAASGPVAALTEMLYARGITVETRSFHQLPTGGRTATFIEGSDGLHSEWAMGLADDPEQSALHAVIACANRLLTALTPARCAEWPQCSGRSTIGMPSIGTGMPP